MKHKSKNSYNTILKILVITVIPIVVFFSTYEYCMCKSYSAYKNSLIGYGKIINEINKTMKSCENSDSSINVNKSKIYISEKIKLLINIRQNLSRINPTDKYRKVNENIISGLDSNINLYRIFLNSLDSNNVEKDKNSIKKYVKSCAEFYDDIDIPNVSLALPKEIFIYIDNLYKYELNTTSSLEY